MRESYASPESIAMRNIAYNEAFTFIKYYLRIAPLYVVSAHNFFFAPRNPVDSRARGLRSQHFVSYVRECLAIYEITVIYVKRKLHPP